jgi:hypothetical protein
MIDIWSWQFILRWYPGAHPANWLVALGCSTHNPVRVPERIYLQTICKRNEVPQGLRVRPPGGWLPTGVPTDPEGQSACQPVQYTADFCL